ncbi:MFS transporter [Streptomyces rectiverticillatus]|uniref:MFS transporter n=1 Tax=Streptomyces rectiverticillatus TaxID=173860 RepID=UPI0015C34818|nr:MFS transporter [Streptomyces rectiverticillatus]QLE75749.1 MFS transporter [Streptomyces rectiverticillatus]
MVSAKPPRATTKDEAGEDGRALTARQLTALVVARATSCAGFFAVLPYLGLWLVDSRGLSGADAGLVVGAAILANRAGGVLLVPLIHRLGLKASVGAGYLGAAVAFAVLGMGLTLPASGWLVLAASAGLSLAMATTALKAQVAAFAPDQRLRGFSYLNMAVNAGSAVGPVLGGFLLERHADALPLAAAALDLVALAAVPALPGAWRAGERPRAHAGGDGRGRGRWLPQRPFVVFSLLVCGTWVAYAQVFDVLPAYLGDSVNTRDLGLVFTLNAVLVVALQVPVSALSRRVLTRPRAGFGILCAAANVVLAAAVLLFAFGRSAGLGLLLGAMVLFTLSELVWSPLYDAQVAERRGALSTTAAYALAGVAWGAAESAGAWLGTLLAVRSSGPGALSPAAAPYWGAAALALLTGLVTSWGGRRKSDKPLSGQERNTHDVDVPARP